MIYLRSALYYLAVFPATVLFSVIGVALLPFPRELRYDVIIVWSKFALWWLSVSCGLSYRVRGRENIPDTWRNYV